MTKEKNNNGKGDYSSALMIGKIPPQAKDLEEAILGAILIQSDCLPNILNLIHADVFYVDSHQIIFKAIIILYDKNYKIDILTVIEQLKSTNELDLVGGAYYVTKLMRDVVSTANIEAHSLIILGKYLGRELINITSEGLHLAYEDTTDIFDLYEAIDSKIISAQERALSGSIKDMRYYAAKVYEQYETVKTTGVLGINTGLEILDKMIGGLVAPDLIILAARPSQGKTALALSITHHTSVLNEIPCAWFSLEMNGTQLTSRLAAIDAQISHEEIRNGSIKPENEVRFFNSLDKIGNSKVFIEDKGIITLRTIRTRTHILKRKNKIQYIVVDYLQLMTGLDTKNKNRESIISEISRGLKELARELNMPIVALSQLSRKVEERSDKMPQLSDLRESGAIEQDADEVIFLMRPEFYEFLDPVTIGKKEYDVRGLCIAKIAKNRHGDCRNFALRFTGASMQFTSHPLDFNISTQQNNTVREYRNYTEPKGLSDEEKNTFG